MQIEVLPLDQEYEIVTGTGNYRLENKCLMDIQRAFILLQKKKQN